MHKFTIEDVSEKDFDLSLLDFKDQDLVDMRNKANISIKRINDKIEAEKEANSTNAKYNHHLNYFSYEEFFRDIDLSNEQIILSFVFVPGLLDKCYKNYCEKYDLYIFQHYIVGELINFFKKSIKLAERVFLDASEITFKRTVFGSHYVSTELLASFVRNSSVEYLDKLGGYTYNNLLDILPPEDCAHLINSKQASVRMTCFKKMGVLKNIDKMIKDESAEIRSLAVYAMSYGDPRFRLFVKEKTKSIFFQIIPKCSEDILLFLMANTKVKKDSDLQKLLFDRIGNRT